MVRSAVPVQAAGRRSPVPGKVGAVVVTDADRSAPRVAPPLGPPEPAAPSSDRVVVPDGAGSLVAVPRPALLDGGDSAADALCAGVDDEAGLCPVIWIKPHTTTTEQTNATTMIT